MSGGTKLDQLSINTIRFLAVDAVQQAASGHPGMPMGAAPMAYVLWTRFLRHNPRNPDWPDRDRFVLSAGHGSMLLYSLLYLTGYGLSLDELRNFRQWGSKTPGHPEYGCAPGVETTTGPLGQGFANGVGMALAAHFLAARFNRPGHTIVDHYVYGIVSDGDLMEGISHEAASLAGHLRLGRLVYLYDDNHISIEGDTGIAFTEDRLKRFEAYNWHVQQVDDGNDLDAIEKAVIAARQETERPSLIAVRTHIGFGSPNKQDRPSAHGEPLGPEEVRLTKQNLGWPIEPAFLVPDDVREHFRRAVDKGRQLEGDWRAALADYRRDWPGPAAEWDLCMEGKLPDGWEKKIPVFPPDPRGKATRATSGEVLNAIAPRVPHLIGGSADLAPSTKTLVKATGDFQFGAYDQRNLRFGVREHGMGGMLNGMALHGGVIPYGATFLIFSDYMRPSMRLAALMGLKVIYVLTHDSIGLGEDGPTHQPVEQLMSLRAVPGLTVIRPADANETAEAWRVAMTTKKGPVVLALTRQSVPTLDRSDLGAASGLERGAYVLWQSVEGDPGLILIGTGSETHIALESGRRLAAEGVKVRVVSMPSWELFDSQSPDYREEILPSRVRARISVEAGIRLGWERYIGLDGSAVGMDGFGASAPARVLYEKFGITVEEVISRARELPDVA